MRGFAVSTEDYTHVLIKDVCSIRQKKTVINNKKSIFFLYNFGFLFNFAGREAAASDVQINRTLQDVAQESRNAAAARGQF